MQEYYRFAVTPLVPRQRRDALDDGTREDPGWHVPRGARDQQGTAQGGLYGEADRVEDGAQGRPDESAKWSIRLPGYPGNEHKGPVAYRE